MKRRTIVISTLIVLCMTFSFSGCGQSCDYEGVWMFSEQYQDDELVSDEAGGFEIIIKDTGDWTIINQSNYTNGTLSELDGKDCIYYDEYIYYLDLSDDTLVINAEPKEGSNATDTGKIVLKKID